MQLDKNPFFRKAITPWYDSSFSCWFLVVMMTIVFAFAVNGVIVASSSLYFKEHVWFPGLLSGLSFFLVVKLLLRLNQRSKNG